MGKAPARPFTRPRLSRFHRRADTESLRGHGHLSSILRGTLLLTTYYYYSFPSTYCLLLSHYYLLHTTYYLLPTTLRVGELLSLFATCSPQNEEDRSQTTVVELWSQPAAYMQFIPHYVAYNSSLRVFYLQHQALLLTTTHYHSLTTHSLLTTPGTPTHYYSLLLPATHYYSLLLTRLTHSPPEPSPRRRGLSAPRALLRDDFSEVRRVAAEATPMD